MNILYTVNEAFVPQLAASVASVCENSSPDDAIHFFVFCDKGVTDVERDAAFFFE